MPRKKEGTRKQRINEMTARLERREQELAAMRRDQLSLNTLLSLVEAMSSELDHDQLLKKTVVSAVKLLGADNGAIGLVDEERRVIHHPAIHNLPDALFYIDVAEGVGISGKVYALKRPVIMNDYSAQVQIPLDNAQMRQIKAVMSVPIWWKGQLVGVFSIGTLDPQRTFDEYDVNVLSRFAKHAAIAIENSRLYGKVERLAYLQERNRIARELHDSVTQSLFTIVLMADAVRNLLRDGENVAPTAELLYQNACETLKEMHALIHELRPMALEGNGLISALQKMADKVRAIYRLPVEVHYQNARRISPEREEALYRIAQEALNNTIKHARASRAMITLRMTESEAHLVVTDDGVGFDPQIASQSSRPGLGLTTMRERAEHFKGCLIVNTRLGCGTQVEARVPLGGN